ncbi:hypothetical protein OROMI_023711 [Orobanche minor]
MVVSSTDITSFVTLSWMSVFDLVFLLVRKQILV